jgi:hypothetical protein
MFRYPTVFIVCSGTVVSALKYMTDNKTVLLVNVYKDFNLRNGGIVMMMNKRMHIRFVVKILVPYKSKEYMTNIFHVHRN